MLLPLHDLARDGGVGTFERDLFNGWVGFRQFTQALRLSTP